MTFGYVIMSIIASGFLPIYEESSVAWVVKADGRPVAVVTSAWDKPKCVVSFDAELQTVFSASEPTLEFEYHSKGNAEELFKKISG